MTISIELYLYLLLTTIFFSFYESNKKATYLSQWSEQDEAHIFHVYWLGAGMREQMKLKKHPNGRLRNRVIKWLLAVKFLHFG